MVANGQDMLDKGMTHIPTGMERALAQLHHTIQNGTQFKTYKWFISGIFYLIFPDWGWPQVTATPESETMDKGRLLYLLFLLYTYLLFYTFLVIYLLFFFLIFQFHLSFVL